MADFTPTFGNYTNVKPFRYWVQTVIPLVYDDSLSYMELLAKVVDYLNKVIEDNKTMIENIDALLEAYNQLQQYVNDYFDNLDVQEEIDNKLDEMVQSGVMSEILDPLVAISTTNWLAEHITPTSPAIDNSLTVAGAGADAKKVGDVCIKSMGTLTGVNSCNDIPNNTIYSVITSVIPNIANCPFNRSFAIRTESAGGRTDNGSKIQTAYYYYSNMIAHRIMLNNTWTDWMYQEVVDYTKFIESQGTVVNTSTYNDVHSLPNNSIFTVLTGAITGGILNAPFSTSFVVMTYSSDGSTGTASKKQTATNLYNGLIAESIYINGTWTPWNITARYESPTTNIQLMLNEVKHVKLGVGEFVIDTLNIGEGCVVDGCGDKTVIKTTGGITINANAQLKNVKIVSNTPAFVIDGNITNYNAIISGESIINALIENVTIENFSGSGIYLNNTGYDVNQITLKNVYVKNCNVGLNINRLSEYNKISDCSFNYCYYGCINNGGNNMFNNVDFCTNRIGMLMDNSGGDKPNNSHGSIVCCTFNHEGENNDGYGLIVKSMAAGEVITGCQFFYSKIRLENVTGFNINNCNMATSGLEVVGGGLLLVNNIVCRNNEFPITVTNNNKVILTNCWYRNGAQIVL